MTPADPFEWLQHSTLIIGDGSSQIEELASRLCVRGHVAVIGPVLQDRFALNPGVLVDYDAVVLAPGNIFPIFDNSTQTTLEDYVSRGGILVGMPFLAWSVANRGNGSLDGLLPVTCADFYEDQHAVWSVTTCLHQETICIISDPRGLSMTTSGEELVAKPGTTVLAAQETPLPGPAITSVPYGSGRVLYFNATHHSHTGDALNIWRDGRLAEVFLHFVTGNYSWEALGIRSFVNPKYVTTRSSEEALFTDETITRHVNDEHRYRRTFPAGRFSARAAGLAHAFRSIEQGARMAQRLEGSRSREAEERYLQYLPMAMRESPYLTVTESDFAGLSSGEKHYFCHVLLRFLSDSVFDSLPPSGTDPDGMKYDVGSWKGRFLERLVEYCFLLDPGFSTVKKNARYDTGEIDILFENQSHDPFLQSLGSPIAIECKNWRTKVGVPDHRVFASKLQELGIRSGLLVSARGPTGSSRRDTLRFIANLKRNAGIVLLSVSADDLKRMVLYQDIAAGLKRHLFQLYA